MVTVLASEIGQSMLLVGIAEPTPDRPRDSDDFYKDLEAGRYV